MTECDRFEEADRYLLIVPLTFFLYLIVTSCFQNQKTNSSKWILFGIFDVRVQC